MNRPTRATIDAIDSMNALVAVLAEQGLPKVLAEMRAAAEATVQESDAAIAAAQAAAKDVAEAKRLNERAENLTVAAQADIQRAAEKTAQAAEIRAAAERLHEEARRVVAAAQAEADKIRADAVQSARRMQDELAVQVSEATARNDKAKQALAQADALRAEYDAKLAKLRSAVE